MTISILSTNQPLRNALKIGLVFITMMLAGPVIVLLISFAGSR